ncbi:MAG TPA: DUF2298 domain-containing protein, partial [Candidatus Norongarragalinales archaeon]|nr:DUF2298 domain-containing protein [Candidatus Norongarragalinales archaeon]
MLLGILFLFATAFVGFVFSKKLSPENHFAFASPLGILVSTWVVFVISLAIGFTPYSVALSSVIVIAAAWFFHKKIGVKKHFLEKNLLPLAILALVFFAGMNYLMFHYEDGEVRGIRTDFGFHKSIIASLANGNFPPENPLFAGIPLTYYYFLHLFSASLMVGGFSLQFAYILPNVLLNASLVLLLFILFRKMFPEITKKHRWLPYVAIALFLFNGNFAFIPYLQQNPITADNFTDFLKNPNFLYVRYYPDYAFETIVTSTLLFQPTMAFGLALLAVILIGFWEGQFNRALLLPFLIPFNLFAFILGITFFIGLLAFDKRWKNKELQKTLGITLALSAIVLFGTGFLAKTNALSFVRFKLGWMSPAQDLISIVLFWAKNLGIYLVLGAIGYKLAKPKVKQFFLASTPLFILGNLFIFTPYEWDGMKLFLLFFWLLVVVGSSAISYFSKYTNTTVLLIALLMVSGVLHGITIAKSISAVYESKDLAVCTWMKNPIQNDFTTLTDGQHTCLFGINGQPVFLGDLEWIKNHGIPYEKQL